MASTVRSAGDEVGGYTVVRTIGAGGSGHVYLVHDAEGSLAALKLVDAASDPIAAERLRREVSALTSLRHDAIPRVLDAEWDDDDTFVVFEYIAGESLFHHVQRHGPLRADELADCAERLADALRTAHEAGVVHRDVTPSNVMMSPRGAVLIDFGLSHRAQDDRLTRDGLVSGTAGYVAPEVIDGAEPGPLADRWAWAATVAFAASGRPPFGVGSGAIRRTLEGVPDLDDFQGAEHVRAALSRDISMRPTMRETVAALRGATEVLPPAAVTEAFAPTPATSVMPAVPQTHVMPAGAEPTAVLPESAATDPRIDAWNGGSDAVADAWGERDAYDERGAWDLDDPEGEGWDEDGTSYDQEWDDHEWDAYEWDEPRPHRPVLLLSWTLMVSAAAAVAPVLAFLTLVLGALTGRATFRRHEAILAARMRHGERRRDVVLHTMGLPWHMTRALVELLPSVLAAAVIGSGVAAFLWWGVNNGLLSNQTTHGLVWGHAVALAVGGLCAAASLWWGLWSGGTREGAHRFADAITPNSGVAVTWVLVAILASAGIITAVALLVQPWWWPLPPMPKVA